MASSSVGQSAISSVSSFANNGESVNSQQRLATPYNATSRSVGYAGENRFAISQEGVERQTGIIGKPAAEHRAEVRRVRKQVVCRNQSSPCAAEVTRLRVCAIPSHAGCRRDGESVRARVERGSTRRVGRCVRRASRRRQARSIIVGIGANRAETQDGHSWLLAFRTSWPDNRC